MAVGYQSFYQAQLTSPISDTDLTIPLDEAPIPDSGFLVIESTVASKREIIYYTSKTTNSVTCPADGRGYDGTTAVSHLSGAVVIMAPVGAMFEELREQFTTTPQGWTSMTQNISTVTANGNRSYNVTFASDVSATLSEGMRLRTTRTSAASVTCFSLDGTNDYFNKTSPSGMTFTDDFTVSAWVYLTSYAGIAGANIASRLNGTSGWQLRLGALGQADGRVQLVAFNGSGSNYSSVVSYQSVPLNKWVHITAQLDMSAYTATTTTSYVMFNGKDVPAFVQRGGTNPTALVQAGNLEIGSANGVDYFPGQLKDICIYGAKVTQADILSRMSQAPTGSETNLISAYSGANTTDLNTTNANNLTAQNGATTVASAPWGNRGLSSTLDYGLVMSVSGSTATVQVPEGCTIPTTGGVTSVAYSTQANPYGWVSDKGRWEVAYFSLTNNDKTSAITASTWYNINSITMIEPIGQWSIDATFSGAITHASTGYLNLSVCISTGASSDSHSIIARGTQLASSQTENAFFYAQRKATHATTTATTWYLNALSHVSSATLLRSGAYTKIVFTPSGL
jgi:hypothetical protein